MLVAKENTKEAVIDELIARCRLTPEMVNELDEAIENELALSENDLTVAEMASEIILDNKVAEF